MSLSNLKLNPVTKFYKTNLNPENREEFYKTLSQNNVPFSQAWRNYFTITYIDEAPDLLALGGELEEIQMGSVDWLYYFANTLVNRVVIEPFNEAHKAKLVDLFDAPIEIADNAFYYRSQMMIPADFDQQIIDAFKANEDGVFFDGGIPYAIKRQNAD